MPSSFARSSLHTSHYLRNEPTFRPSLLGLLPKDNHSLNTALDPAKNTYYFIRSNTLHLSSTVWCGMRGRYFFHLHHSYTFHCCGLACTFLWSILQMNVNCAKVAYSFRMGCKCIVTEGTFLKLFLTIFLNFNEVYQKVQWCVAVQAHRHLLPTWAFGCHFKQITL